MIVKLSCSHSAETPGPGYTVGESLRCPQCDTVQRILVIEAEASHRSEPTPDERLSNDPEWPTTNPDGSPKRMGDLTQAQQHEQFSLAVKRLQPEFAREGIKLVEGDGKATN